MAVRISNVSGNFLIAVPGTEDPSFSRTVILVCEHTGQGAFGLVINRLLMNSFVPLMQAFDLSDSVVDLPVFYGGPVKPDQGYIVYEPEGKKYDSLRVGKNLSLTASREILFDIAGGKGPNRFLFALGFAGWESRQLEDELMMDQWLIAPFRDDILFTVPVNERWRSAAQLIGVDFDRYSDRAGHA